MPKVEEKQIVILIVPSDWSFGLGKVRIGFEFKPILILIELANCSLKTGLVYIIDWQVAGLTATEYKMYPNSQPNYNYV